ncbi:ABC-2 type transport system ATP-binding protein [Seinonella peptonophila]|uniref:ABC-2 type transport system ATP-binding protein n=2 Tax=Seinonella peptonophila TaxID=112248 RepID=A0A1M4SVQ8_9BACL|nr:ABC-2 type transport system ATP-binding protein [Seinonella peptonophila]
MKTILECKNLLKRYGKHNALINLDLTLQENTIYGLFGCNGAGKTTLLNMISGNIFPDRGVINVNEKRLNYGDSSKEICYISEKQYYFSGVKVIDLLELAAAFHNRWDWNFANQLLKEFKLNPQQKIGQLSRGMKTILGNTIGLASRAPLTIYDEPEIGLDVLMREKFYRILIDDYSNNPRTILLSTHLIDEVTKVIEHFFIIESGTILLKDAVENICISSHLLTGNRTEIEKFTSDKQVIYQESYGKGMLTVIYDLLTEEDKRRAKIDNISVERLSLQKFFAYLLERRESSGERTENSI